MPRRNCGDVGEVSGTLCQPSLSQPSYRRRIHDSVPDTGHERRRVHDSVPDTIRGVRQRAVHVTIPCLTPLGPDRRRGVSCRFTGGGSRQAARRRREKAGGGDGWLWSSSLRERTLIAQPPKPAHEPDHHAAPVRRSGSIRQVVRRSCAGCLAVGRRAVIDTLALAPHRRSPTSVPEPATSASAGKGRPPRSGVRGGHRARDDRHVRKRAAAEKLGNVVLPFRKWHEPDAAQAADR